MRAAVAAGADEIDMVIDRGAFLSGDYENEDGVYRLPEFEEDSVLETRGIIPDHQIRPNTLERVSLRANLGANVSADADLQPAAHCPPAGTARGDQHMSGPVRWIASDILWPLHVVEDQQPARAAAERPPRTPQLSSLGSRMTIERSIGSMPISPSLRTRAR